MGASPKAFAWGAAAATAAAAAGAAVWLGSTGQPPVLPVSDGAQRARWAHAGEKGASVSEEDRERFETTGRLLVRAAVPAELVEELLLPSLLVLSTPRWAITLLRHLHGRFEVVRYGVSFWSREARDFWTLGPAALIAGQLLGLGLEGQPLLLLADALYTVAEGSHGLPFHSDAESSFCLTHPDAPGLSLWLALDDTSSETGGGLEVCDAPILINGSAARARNSGAACEVYGARRGDAVLFSKHAPHRTVPWRGAKAGRRRALVGRLVPSDVRLRRKETPSGLIFTNGFDGPYLCSHGLEVGDTLRGSACFPPLTPSLTSYPSGLPPPKLLSPAWPLSRYACESAAALLVGTHLTQALALALTLAVELMLAHVWWQMLHTANVGCIPHHGRLLAACAAASMFTHPFVWLWAAVLFPAAHPLVRVGVVETLVVLVEGSFLNCMLRGGPHVPCANMLALATTMNVGSVLVGWLLTWALEMQGDGFSVETSAVSWCLGVSLTLRLLGVT